MKNTRTFLIRSAIFAAACSALLATYTYYFTDTLTSINTTNWTQNGTLTASSSGLTSSSSNGGSLISKVSGPAPANDYEVKTTLTLTQSSGDYITYLRASSNALIGPSPAGTAYAFVVESPTFSGSACTATLVLYKMINGAVTNLGSTTIPCQNGMVVRAIYTAYSGSMMLYVNNVPYFGTVDTSIASGQPGIGVVGAPAGNSISEVQLGGMYTGAPVMPPANEFGVSAFANKIELQWPGAYENPSGPGVTRYQIWRNSTYVGYVTGTEAFVDTGLTASTSYTYLIRALDYDLNASPQVTITTATPPTGAIDAREIGVRPTGSYWGGAGEQIDMQSGNLNYTVPMVKAMGRGGWSVGFNLTYNSQNWRIHHINTRQRWQ